LREKSSVLIRAPGVHYTWTAGELGPTRGRA
jgi:hypothetical protein